MGRFLCAVERKHRVARRLLEAYPAAGKELVNSFEDKERNGPFLKRFAEK
ncbi:hypothetical protein [Sporosarcina koreensis]|nr:hypothetical protein [Sporosarcina koreensis]